MTEREEYEYVKQFEEQQRAEYLLDQEIYRVHNVTTRRPVCHCDDMGKNECVIDRAGYIPAKVQIQNLIAAGEKLEEYRRRMYSNEPTPDDVEPDVTLRKDYTVQDAMDDAKALGKKAEKAMKAQKEALEREQKKEAELAELARQDLKQDLKQDVNNNKEKPKDESTK